MGQTLDLSSGQQERVVFRRVRGRIVPIRVSTTDRIKERARIAVAPSIVAGLASEGIRRGASRWALKGSKLLPVAIQAGQRLAAFKRVGKVAAMAFGFNLAYAAALGARQKHVLEMEPEQRRSKARIYLASKPGFAPGHNLGEHSYLVIKDRGGKLTSFGGQIKDAGDYGDSGVKVVKNFRKDKISRAHNVYDLTPHDGRKTDAIIKRVHRVVAKLKKQTKRKEYVYASLPVRKDRYNSNSVTGTIVRRSRLSFRYDPKKHNLPGFERSIPNEVK